VNNLPKVVTQLLPRVGFEPIAPLRHLTVDYGCQITCVTGKTYSILAQCSCHFSVLVDGQHEASNTAGELFTVAVLPSAIVGHLPCAGLVCY